MLKIKSHSETVADTHFTLDNSLLFARPLGEASAMNCSFKKELKNNINEIPGVFLLISLEPVEVMLNGPWYIEKITVSRLTTLCAFLDYQKELSDKKVKLSRNKSGTEISTVLVNDNCSFLSLLEEDSLSFISTLICNMIKPESNCIEQLFIFVRNMESYWVARFLLSRFMAEEHSGGGHKLSNAWDVYGVSESYFRKLCHNAFICGPKKQLRIWRAAHSALQLIEKDASISMVAIDNSYSSSSHFTSEMKSIFGVTPREFRKMVGLFHE